MRNYLQKNFVVDLQSDFCTTVPMALERLYTYHDLMARWGASWSTIYRFFRKSPGVIKPTSGTVRFPESTIRLFEKHHPRLSARLAKF
jgi:hypothetical protein